jgi:Holliday junction resolvasome RuvABC endonuclease subunit
MPAPTSDEKAARYDELTNAVMERVLEFSPRGCLVLIEAHVFHVAQSSSITQLAEIGGVIRNKLYAAGYDVREISPTAIKKWFSGSGAADKQRMWNAFLRHAPHLKLAEWLPASFNNGHIPSPHQDLVDSFAIAHSLHRQTLKQHRIWRAQRASSSTKTRVSFQQLLAEFTKPASRG